jgi:hypothetical protein
MFRSNRRSALNRVKTTSGSLLLAQLRGSRYLEANADASQHLASLTADFVDYGRTKQRLERLTDKLELQPKTN